MGNTPNQLADRSADHSENFLMLTRAFIPFLLVVTALAVAAIGWRLLRRSASPAA
jgi:hypothetical protein